MWKISYWRDVAERILATAAEAALATITGTAMIQQVNWSVVGGVTALAALAALLKAVVARGVAESDTASLVTLRKRG